MLAGRQPVPHGPRPENGVAFNKEDIAGEDGAVRGHVNDHVPLGMGGPHLLQMHRLAPHGEGAFPLKGFCGQALLHAFKIEGAKAVKEEVPEIPELTRAGSLGHGGHGGRVFVGHFLGAGLRGNDGGLRQAAVAIAVIAVGVGVDQLFDVRSGGNGRAHGLKHALRQGAVVERIDEERCVPVSDQPRVGPAPAAVGLEVGPASAAQVAQALLIGSYAKPRGFHLIPLLGDFP